MKALPTNSSPPLLSLKGISFAYNTPKSEIPALDNIYLDIMPQSFTSIVGPSGLWQIDLAFHHMRASFATEG